MATKKTWLGTTRRRPLPKASRAWGPPVLVTGLTGGPLAGGCILLRTSYNTLTIVCRGQVGRYESGLWVPA